MLGEFLIDYGLFAAKLVTAAALLLTAVLFVVYMVSRVRQGIEGHFEVRHLNNRYEQMQLLLNSAMLPKKAFRQATRELQAGKRKQDSTGRKRLFVLDFKGDLRASQVSSLREEITAILTVARDGDEVLIRLESGGGTVHGYGLGASQLRRLRDRGLKLTISVDKVAASGGYMMACVGDRIIAAPFAVIGSIGVLFQMPNFNRLLKRHDIDYEQITAGPYKRTLTVFGENTEADRERMQQELEQTHALFKEFVQEQRPAVDIDRIATGEHWYGRQAVERGLVDELLTSDDFLCRAVNDAEIYEIEYVRRKSPVERLFAPVASAIDDLRL